MSVKLKAAMPKGEHNGLKGQEERVEALEGSLVAIVVMAEISELGRIVSTDEAKVILEVAEIEIVDRERAADLLREGRKARTGVEELDFDGLEDGDGDE